MRSHEGTYMNHPLTTTWGTIAPEEEARALLRQLAFDCVNGDMRAGKSAVVSATPGWDPQTGAFRVDLRFRALGAVLPDFGGLKVSLRYRSEHISGFPETRVLDDQGRVSFELNLDALSAQSAVFLVSAEKTEVPMRQSAGPLYEAEPLWSSYAADTSDSEWTFWKPDPIRPGILHCLTSDELVRATAKYTQDDEGRVFVDLHFRAEASLAGRCIYWAIGIDGRLDREGELALTEQSGQWWFTPSVTLTLNNDDRQFYFKVAPLAGETA
jgi:hypothetical protein